MFNKYIHDIANFNSKIQLEFSELIDNGNSRIQEADRGDINCLMVLKLFF